MKGLTNYITERPWSDIMTEWYVRDQSLVTKRSAPFRLSGPEPELVDRYKPHPYNSNENISILTSRFKCWSDIDS